MSAKKSNTVNWIILTIILGTMLLIPSNGIYHGDIKAFLIITAAGIGMVAMGLFSSPLVPSMLLLFGYSLIVGFETAMAGWAKDAPWSILCMFLIIDVMNKTNLFRRISYHIISITGGTYAGICVGLYLVGLLFSLLGSSVTPAIIAVGYGITASLKMERTKAGAGIMGCAILGNTEAGWFIFNPVDVPFFYSIASSSSTLVKNSNYFEWLRNGLIFIIYYFLLLILVILLCRPKDGLCDNAKEFFQNELKKLPPISSDEKKITIIICIMLLYLILSPLHGQKLVYGFVGAVVLLYLPATKLEHLIDIRMDISYPIFVVACIAIGSVASTLGLGEAIVELLVPYLADSNLYIYFLVICIICFLLNFVMTPLAIFTSMLVPLTAVTLSFPTVHDIYPLILTLYIGTGNVLLPYEMTNTLVLYSFNAMTLKDFMRIYGMKFILSLLALLAGVAYWKVIGILS